MKNTGNQFHIGQWCKTFLNVSHLTTSREVPNDLFAICLMEKILAPLPNSVTDSFSFTMVSKRAELIGLKSSDYFRLVLALESNTPGEGVMWVTAMRYAQYLDSLKDKNIFYTGNDFLRLVKKLPDKEHMNDMWESQKNKDAEYKVDNWLDAVATEETFINAVKISTAYGF